MSKTVLRCDLETFSSVDLKKAGVHKYVESPDFQILLFAYAVNAGPVYVVDLAQGEVIPDHVIDALYDEDVTKTAYNAAFEIACLNRHLGRREMDVEQWRCTSVHALYLGLPGNLADVGKVVGLAPDKQKLSSGWALIRYFCMPCKPTKKNGLRTRNLPHHDMQKWLLFIEYCRRDVETEREIANRLAKFPVPDIEWRLWHLDQRMMTRGVKIDRELVSAAIEADSMVRQRLTNEAIAITGLANPNSRDQLLAWLEEEMDEEIDNLTKKTVPRLLETTDSAVVERVLRIRQELAKTSVTKYHAMARAVCLDDVIRGLTQFYGANRTGRWAGRIVQVQNLPQNKLRDLHLARELLKSRDYETLELLFGSVPDVLSQLIRTAFVARPGTRFIPVDFSAIEARVIAWLAWCEWRLEVFKTHGKIYEASAEQMFKLPPGSVTKKSPYRQKGKVAELACFGPYTQVLTSRGIKAITAVSTSDLLWDGQEWVRHDGLIYRGVKATINLAGIEVTPDHLIRTGPIWTPAQQLASNESTLCQALATGSANSPCSLSSAFGKGPATWILPACSALVARLRTWFTPQISERAPAPGVRLAQKRPQAIGARSGIATRRFALTTRTAAACSIGSQPLWFGATAQTPGSGRTMGVEASRSMSRGEKTRPRFLRIWSRLMGGMTQATTWTGLTSTRATSQATSASSPGGKTEGQTSAPFGSCSSESQSLRPVFDLLNAGPRNRFTIISDRGPLLVHNCGYQGSVGALKSMGALEMGIPEEELRPIIDDWREANPEIVDLWYAVERAAQHAVARRTSVTLAVADGRAHLVFSYESGFLFIRLPSGRRLAYVKPRIEPEDLYRPTSDGGRFLVASKGSLTYEGNDQKTKQWVRLATYGGKLVENITQAIARDCLREAMLALDEACFDQLFTVHDEIITEVAYGMGELTDVEAIMGRPISWAPDLPLRGDGFETEFYMKEID